MGMRRKSVLYRILSSKACNVLTVYHKLRCMSTICTQWLGQNVDPACDLLIILYAFEAPAPRCSNTFGAR